TPHAPVLYLPSLSRRFSTKDREPWLHAELRPRLWEYLSGAIRSEGGLCLLANGVFDHVHLLARLRQEKTVSDVLRSIKGTRAVGSTMLSQSSVDFIGRMDMGPLR